MQFYDAVALFHKIDADCVVNGDVFFVLAIPIFMKLFAYIDVFVFMFKGDVVGKEPELGVADVVVVDPDAGYFHQGGDGGCIFCGWRFIWEG